MKIACSSESFSRSFASGEFTQLEWLDACANELEVDGVIFAFEHFPRTDADYLAQLKKTCADLGLTIAAVSFGIELWPPNGDGLAIALALGAPLAIAPAAPFSEDAAAWGAFTDAVQQRAREAKSVNVTLAIRNAPATLCPTGADLRRLAKDIDSSWLRFALDVATLDDADVASTLAKTVIAHATIDDTQSFAQPTDELAPKLIARLARFRGFVSIDPTLATNAPRNAYHEAIDRFTHLRSRALEKLAP